MKKIILNGILSVIAFVFTGLGTSITIKAAVGISSFNSLNVGISDITNIKIGTVTIFLNLLFLIFYIFLTKFNYKLKYLLQFIAVNFIGIVINFFTYNIFSKITIENYYIRLIILIIGVIIGASFVALIMVLDSISFPVEAFCLVYAEKNKSKFSTIRRFIDIICVTISLLITIIFNKPLTIREGTIISLLLFSTIIGKVYKKLNNYEFLKKLKIFI